MRPRRLQRDREHAKLANVKLSFMTRKWAQLGLLAALLTAFAPTLALAAMDAGQFRASLGVDCSARVVTAATSAATNDTVTGTPSVAPSTGSTSAADHCQADCGYCFWNAPAALPVVSLPPVPALAPAHTHTPREPLATHARTVFLHDAAPRGPPLSC
jgi:hypothetical protein